MWLSLPIKIADLNHLNLLNKLILNLTIIVDREGQNLFFGIATRFERRWKSGGYAPKNAKIRGIHIAINYLEL